jgi:hypothetical protein
VLRSVDGQTARDIVELCGPTVRSRPRTRRGTQPVPTQRTTPTINGGTVPRDPTEHWGESALSAHRAAARITGALFIIALVASPLSLVFLGSLDSSDYLTKISENQGQVAVGVLLLFIAAFASAGIALSLYPVLRKHREGLALGAVGFRLIEGMFYALGAVSALLLLTLSQEFVKTGAGDPAYFHASGTLLKAADDWTGLAGVFAFYLGGLMYYCAFYQTRLVPRWLAAWGVGAVTLGFVAAVLVLFGATHSMSTVQVVLNLPIAANELVLAIWLIVKGFRPSPAATGVAELT